MGAKGEILRILRSSLGQSRFCEFCVRFCEICVRFCEINLFLWRIFT
ncbi:hypothetical protein [Helicobacter sp. 23-1045]